MRATTSISREAASSFGPKRVTPSATPLTGACLPRRAWKSGAEIVFGNSTVSISPRSLRSAQPAGAIDCVISSFFLFVAISVP